MELYPLIFEPILKKKIWGGHKLFSEYGKGDGKQAIGESWELSGLKEAESVVRNGALTGKKLSGLIKEYKGELVGDFVYQEFKDEFPLLIKFLDAAADLSIQVHPDNELARKRHGSDGKTEMWYVCSAEPGSELIVGFNKKVSKQDFLKLVEIDQLNGILNKEQANKGDVFYIPAGRIHTIGKGVLIAEIQQASDLTYRVSDFNRKDANGQQRELHTQQAAEALDFNTYNEYKNSYEEPVNGSVELVSSPFFRTNKINFEGELVLDYSSFSSFVIYVCIEGEFSIKNSTFTFQFKKGEVVFLPACVNHVQLISESNVTFLELYIPKS
jgi:mannose-6-phosphate isomerase